LRALAQKLKDDGDPYWAGQVDMQATTAQAWIDLAEGRRAAAISTMRRAAELDDHSEKHIAMENRLLPMRELLGEILMETGDPAAALAEFKASLLVSPNRFRSFAGAATAAERLRDMAEARRWSRKLIDLCAGSAGDRPQLAAARELLSAK
jgi:tetratricopeptide (TPR) repeat protein